MTRSAPISLLLATLLSVASAQAGSCGSGTTHAVFTAPSGAVITLDMRSGTIRTPHSQSDRLQDCSDKFQTCLTNHHGFAFAYFRNCNDVDYKKLKFHPKIVSALHNNLWMVFDAAPNYMFHYVIPKGIVGIYVGPTPSFDFRSLFREKNLKLNKLDGMEYRVTGSGSVAACSE